ncbi:MAG TPA: MATE family efflux transporter [Polyangia bacterium]|nr:MATE family efflux transporter [Polyangia bacterium]
MGEAELAPTPPPQSTVALVKEAIRGSRRDLTGMPIGRSILFLAVPMVLEMVMESIFALADIFWVGRLGPQAIATVALTEQMLILVYTGAMGLAIGCSALVARRIGEKEPDKAASAAFHGILQGVVLGAVVAVLGIWLAPQLLSLMGAEPGVMAGVSFTRVMLGGSVTVILLFMINSAFRGAGDPAISMRVLAVANVINIVLGPCFIFGWGPFPKMGVTGAAVATTIGRGIGVLYQLRCLRRGSGHLRVRAQHLRYDGALMRTMLRLSGSGILQLVIGNVSWLGLVRVITSFGTVALAGYQIAIRIVLFAILPSFGMASAAATLVGQNLGAGHPERAERAVWRTSLYNVFILGAVGVAFFVGADLWVSLFSKDPEVRRYGALCLRIVAAGFPFYAFGMVTSMAFNGAGDTRTPTWINFFCFWLLEIPLAFLLSHSLRMGPTGVFISITVAFCSVAVISVVLFRRGAWKQVKV